MEPFDEFDSKKRKLDELLVPTSPGPDSLPTSPGPDLLPTSPTGSDSVPPTPQPPRLIGEGDDQYEIEKEFNYGDYVFQRDSDGFNFPVLSPVSDSSNVGGGRGLCSYYATTDTCETRMRIFEATSPPKESKYFNNYFGDRLSVENLVDTGLDNKLTGLMTHMAGVGVTSKDEYDRLSPRAEGHPKLKDLSGCRRFKLNSWKAITGRKLKVTVADIEGMKGSDDDDDGDDDDDNDDDDDDGLVITNIRKYGPVVGAFMSTMDYEKLCEQPIYDQTLDPTPMYVYRNGKRYRVGHAVMLVGYGVARHVRTDKKVAYYVLQDNSGEQHDNEGRILSEILQSAWIPVLYGQRNLVKFRQRGGTGQFKMIPKEFRDPHY